MGIGIFKKYALLGVVIMFLSVAGTYSVYQLFVPNIPEIPGLPQASPPPPPPSFSIDTKDARTVVITWHDLPPGADVIEIFRRRLKTTKWVSWRIISLTRHGGSGSAEITLAAGENANNYTYYFVASSDEGETVINTSSTPIGIGETTPTAPPPPPETPPPPPPPPPPDEPAPTGGSTTTEQTSGGTEPTSTPSNEVYYYNPQGQVSATTTPQSQDFWVQYVNKAIEVGWQNLPQDATRLKVSRSTHSSGPWSVLLDQDNPVLGAPSYIRFVDDTVTADHYYKIDVYAGGTITKTGGPLLLPAY